ncbi:MAG: putative restriction endonuclease-like [Gemmatimonadetes bacterium]|nr:putative restriction endonuclease-like [Gemmatimonadota bacterium]
MALWMVRVGRSGEHERHFRENDRIYLTWDELQEKSLLKTKDQGGVMSLLNKVFPDRSQQQNAAWAFQIDRFIHTMKLGDLTASPLPASSTILFAKIVGDYEFDPSAPIPYRHSRRVEWIGEPRPRTALDEDIKASLSAAVTICSIAKNDAESRIRKFLKLGGPVPSPTMESAAGVAPHSKRHPTCENWRETESRSSFLHVSRARRWSAWSRASLPHRDFTPS